MTTIKVNIETKRDIISAVTASCRFFSKATYFNDSKATLTYICEQDNEELAMQDVMDSISPDTLEIYNAKINLNILSY
jgi:hypothetical protein